ncbi:hypothetical protein [Kribbella deserti]|uniref:Secreted protein n=1 Tax=Kribbella deserti TaxID=1926257 RepID=A0ABV6QSJ0_9ACTN
MTINRVLALLALPAILAGSATTAGAATLAVPPNDTMDTAAELTVGRHVLDTREATRDNDADSISEECGNIFSPPKGTVWYKVTATTDRVLTVDSAGSNYRVELIGVRKNPPFHSFDCKTKGARTTLNVKAGETVYLLSMTTAPAAGTLRLTVTG